MGILLNHPAAQEFSPLIGSLIQNFGVIEITSHRWIEALSQSAIATEISKELPLGKRIDIIRKLLPHNQVLTPELKSKADDLWRKIKDNGLEIRNTVAHGTVGLTFLDHDPNLEPQTIGILKVTKWQTHDELMTIEELRNAIDVTAKIANELNAILPA